MPLQQTVQPHETGFPVKSVNQKVQMGSELEYESVKLGKET